jgi:hypothetical protein
MLSAFVKGGCGTSQEKLSQMNLWLMSYTVAYKYWYMLLCWSSLRDERLGLVFI